MNRRSFLKALGIGAGDAGVVALCPVPEPIPEPLTFKGIPLVFDARVPPNRIIMLSKNGAWMSDGDGWVKL